MSGIVLSAATRQSLLSAQDTASLLAQTQNRLATGKKVNSALDNPTNFFTASGLDNRAGDLSALLDGISNGIQTIQAASTGITSIQKLVDTAKSIANQALSDKSVATAAAPATAATLTASVSYGTPKDFTGKDASFKLGTTDIKLDEATLSAVSSDVKNVGVGDVVKAINNQIKNTAALNTAGVANYTASATQDGRIVLTSTATGSGVTTAVDATAADTDIGFGTAAAVTATGTAAGTGGGAVNTNREAFAKQFNGILDQIDQLAKDASYNGVNLLNDKSLTNKLKIAFNETGGSSIDVQGQDATSGVNGLNLAKQGDPATGVGGFQTDASINIVLTSITNATNTLRQQASTLGSNLTVVQARQDFTKNLVNVLQTGSANLTNADLNEEAANSQALSTRQSLAISALSLANTAQQGVLQLLR